MKSEKEWRKIIKRYKECERANKSEEELRKFSRAEIEKKRREEQKKKKENWIQHGRLPYMGKFQHVWTVRNQVIIDCAINNVIRITVEKNW